jgi:hypothetical protein
MGKPASGLLPTEVTHAVQRAFEAALAAVLQQQQPQKKPKNKTTKPLSPASTVKQVAKAAAKATKSYKQSSKHGFRGVPPPLDFSLAELRDDQLLTEFEVAALTRLSTCSFEAWRRRPDHPLKWVRITGGRVRYRAGDVRDFIASGYRPQMGRPKKDKGTAAAQRRRAAPR